MAVLRTSVFSHCNHMSLSYRKGDRTKRDDTALAELRAGQDKIFELLQGLAGELRELKGSVGAVQTGFARSSWEQRDQETMKSVKAGKPWELGFGIAPAPKAPAPTPSSQERRPSKDVVTSYTRLEDEKDGEDEKNGGATVVAGKPVTLSQLAVGHCKAQAPALPKTPGVGQSVHWQCV